jgi:hypothetical protein
MSAGASSEVMPDVQLYVAPVYKPGVSRRLIMRCLN